MATKWDKGPKQEEGKNLPSIKTVPFFLKLLMYKDDWAIAAFPLLQHYHISYQ